MAKQKITEKFLKALAQYLGGEILMDKAVEVANLNTRKQFQDRMKIAYSSHMLIVRSHIDPQLGTKVREWIAPARGIEAYVVKGVPDDETFLSCAAEKFLGFLKRLFLNEEKKEINIGIVSGTSTADLIEHVVQGGLWQEVMGGLEFRGKKKVNIVAMCSTTLDDWDLEGNANISTLRLARVLRDNLQGFEVVPLGISTELIVLEKNRPIVDGRISNRRKLEIVDPRRINAKSQDNSKLDILITGVGNWIEESADSVFQKVLQREKISVPEGIVGDLGFWPLNSSGDDLELRNSDGELIFLYSLITAKTMRELAEGSGTVMLVARNHRRGRYISKTSSIRAAIRGRYIDTLFTDEDTVNDILREPF